MSTAALIQPLTYKKGKTFDKLLKATKKFLKSFQIIATHSAITVSIKYMHSESQFQKPEMDCHKQQFHKAFCSQLDHINISRMRLPNFRVVPWRT